MFENEQPKVGYPFKEIVESMHHGVVTVTRSRAIEFCNSSFASLVKAEPTRLIGSPIFDCFSPADRSLLEGRFHSHQPLCEPPLLTIRTSDGVHVPVSVAFNLTPLSGALAACLVLTPLSDAAASKQSNRDQDEVLAMLAHELRNPLAPIANAVHMLDNWNKGANNVIVQVACDIVDRQVKQMTRIVDDLLEISRITRGTIALQKSPVDITSIVTAAIETSVPMIEARKHTLNISRPTEILEVDADIVRMTQVVSNLLTNAAKYTEEGGEISLSVHRDGDDAVISVKDNGTGIAPNLLPHIFELFTQAERTLDRSQGGLGIGLALVRSLVHLHNGSVHAYSEGVGRGSEFVIRLPILMASQPQQSVEEPVKEVATTAHRILVVDDNVDSAMTLALMLETMGHESVVAHDGLTALETAESFRPNLILLDVGLPGMNGFAVSEQLRATPHLKDIVIAGLTGYGEDEDRKRSEEAGFDYHFVKPIDPAELEELINSLPPAANAMH